MCLCFLSVSLSLVLSDSAIVNGVYWSEALNKVFVDNFERDPSLIWQYFGSAKGFFRQYPGEYYGDYGGLTLWRHLAGLQLLQLFFNVIFYLQKKQNDTFRLLRLRLWLGLSVCI